jgi:hypothetical protein
MTMPRIRIAWMMAIVAVAALDCGAIRGLMALKNQAQGNQYNIRVIITCDVLMVAALPMANILAVGFRVGLGRWRRRPFLVGFEVFGTLALVVCVFLAIRFPEQVMEPYVASGAELILRPFRPLWRNLDRVVFYPFVSVMLLAPQVAVALFGGWLIRRLTIDRAPAPTLTRGTR